MIFFQKFREVDENSLGQCCSGRAGHPVTDQKTPRTPRNRPITVCMPIIVQNKNEQLKAAHSAAGQKHRPRACPRGGRLIKIRTENSDFRFGLFKVGQVSSYGQNGSASLGVGFQQERIMRKFLADFLSDESGATAIEYGLIAAGIAVAIIAAVQSVGTALNANLGASATAINP